MPSGPSLDQMPRGAHGRRLCRWCQVEVPRGRISFCSEPCVEEYKIRRSAGDARRRVEKRDHGICARCGCDTLMLARVLNAARSSINTLKPPLRYRVPYDWRAKLERLLGFDPHRINYWDADHIVAVVDGGGGCGIDNYQTLCQPCHKQKTKEAARRRKR